MKSLTLQEIQKEAFMLLKAFDSFCKKYDLKYTLSSGTLLGAVRHNGFIPWDDDIDVAMIRPEYEKMKEIFRKDSGVFGKYDLISEEDDCSWYSYAQLVNKEIIVRRKYFDTLKFPRYLWLDIFPIDGYSSNARSSRRICRKIRFWSVLLANCFVKPGTGTTVFRTVTKIPVIFISRILGARYCRRKLIKQIRTYPYETCTKCGPIFWGNDKYAFPKSIYESMTEVKFEGSVFPAISGWNEYLTAVYGNYMQIPSVSKRMDHDQTAYRISGIWR